MSSVSRTTCAAPLTEWQLTSRYRVGRSVDLPRAIPAHFVRGVPRCGLAWLHLDEFLLAAQPALEVRGGSAGFAPEQFVRGVARRFDQLHVAFEVSEA